MPSKSESPPSPHPPSCDAIGGELSRICGWLMMDRGSKKEKVELAD
jgi:hypothetical protein